MLLASFQAVNSQGMPCRRGSPSAAQEAVFETLFILQLALDVYADMPIRRRSVPVFFPSLAFTVRRVFSVCCLSLAYSLSSIVSSVIHRSMFVGPGRFHRSSPVIPTPFSETVPLNHSRCIMFPHWYDVVIVYTLTISYKCPSTTQNLVERHHHKPSIKASHRAITAHEMAKKATSSGTRHLNQTTNSIGPPPVPQLDE